MSTPNDPSDSPPKEDFASLLAEYDAKSSPQKKKRREPEVGQEVKGRIVSIGRDSAFVDLGGKSDGILELVDLRDSEGKLLFAVGDVVEARVVATDARGLLLRRAAGKSTDASDLQQAFSLQLPVEGRVSGLVKGGFEVEVGKHRGFVPVSQIDLRPTDDQQAFVGQKLQFRITRLETQGSRLNLVLSRRTLLEAEQAERAEQVRAQLVPGAVVQGTVVNVRDFGAFVDLGGIEGLIHVSELGFRRVEHPSELLQVGQKLTVQIKKIEKGPDGKERIGLSLRALEADPWSDVGTRYYEGVSVRGVVRRLESFGAFVELEPGIDGLLHISELGGGRRLKHSKDVLTIGAPIDVVVQSVDAEKRRISLQQQATATAKQEETAAIAAAPVAPKSLGTFGDLLAKSGAGAGAKKGKK